MPDRETVSYGLRCMCYGNVECKECPYAKDGSGWHSCRSNCAKDALELLKEQEATIKRQQDVIDIMASEQYDDYPFFNDGKCE